MDSLVQSAQPAHAVQVDARCAMCRSYVHRYLDRCPVCGDTRSSAFEQAVDEWQAFAFDPGSAEADGASSSTPSPALVAARDEATRAFAEAEARFRRSGQLVLRYEGGLPGIPTSHDVKVALVNGQLEVRDERAGRLLMTFDPGDVLAAIPSAGRRPAADAWSNVFTSGVAPAGSGAIWGGAFTVVFVHDGAGVQFGLANRPGFFTTKARADYFLGLAREFADLCDAAARHRELVDGPMRYAHSIGLRAANESVVTRAGASPGAPSDAARADAARADAATADVATADVAPSSAATADVAAPRPAAPGSRTLAELLEQLEAAFRAGLITAAERDAKRQEILRRF